MLNKEIKAMNSPIFIRVEFDGTMNINEVKILTDEHFKNVKRVVLNVDEDGLNFIFKTRKQTALLPLVLRTAQSLNTKVYTPVMSKIVGHGQIDYRMESKISMESDIDGFWRIIALKQMWVG